jgi:hypothetical protein
LLPLTMCSSCNTSTDWVCPPTSVMLRGCAHSPTFDNLLIMLEM